MSPPRLNYPVLLDELHVETWIERQSRRLNFPFENPAYVVCTVYAPSFDLLFVSCPAVYEIRLVHRLDIYGQLFTRGLTQTAVLRKQWAFGFFFIQGLTSLDKCPSSISFRLSRHCSQKFMFS